MNRPDRQIAAEVDWWAREPEKFLQKEVCWYLALYFYDSIVAAFWNNNYNPITHNVVVLPAK